MTQQTINVGTVAGDNTGDPGRTAFQKINNNFTELYNASGGSVLITSVSGTNTITGTCTGYSAYFTGSTVSFVAAGANTGATTLNINGLGAKAITKQGSTALTQGDIKSGQIVMVTYDGTRFQLIPSKINPIVSVMDFGAVGDGTTDDTAAIQAAITYCKTFSASGTLPSLFFSSNGDNKTYKITSPLNFTGIRTVGFLVDFCGSTISGSTSGLPIIDALDTQHISFRNGVFYGNPSSTPNYGIQMGRGIAGNDAANCSIYNLQFTGNYSKAAFLNAGCEVFIAEKCNFWNSSTASTATCLTEDSKNASNVSSTFFTVTVPSNVQQSLNDNVYLNCAFEQIGGAGASGAAAISITSTTNALRFLTCYAQNTSTRVCDIGAGTQTNMVFDVHCEPPSVTNNIRLKTADGNIVFDACQFVEYYLFATDAMFTTTGAGGTAKFYSCVVEVQNSASAAIFKNNGTTIDYHGVVKIGTSGYLYNFSQLYSIAGNISCKNVYTSLTLPFLSNVNVSSAFSFENVFYGTARIGGSGALYLNAGINIASAATITILPYGFEFYITGSTNISKISVAASDTGRIVRLIFGGSITLSNSYTNGTLLASNFAASANQSILLYCNGTVWQEISRCLNVVA